MFHLNINKSISAFAFVESLFWDIFFKSLGFFALYTQSTVDLGRVQTDACYYLITHGVTNGLLSPGGPNTYKGYVLPPGPPLPVETLVQ